MDDNPEIRDRLNVNKSTYHNKRPCERFICFIRGAKWMKFNQLNGPSPIHDTSTWLSQSIQSIRHVCYWLDMQKNLPWKCFRTAFGHYDFRSTTASQQAWGMRKRYHLLFLWNRVYMGDALSVPFIVSWFKIFPQFWLAKSTSIIHHNQLLRTKFGRILCLTRKWRHKCSLLQVNAPLNEKTWGRGWVVFVVETKMADTSLDQE